MKKNKILNKLFTLLTVAIMCFCLFAIPAFAASSEAIPISDGMPGTYPDYPYACPTDRESVYFAWPFEYGLIPVEGDRTFNLNNKVGATLESQAEYYVRIVMSAWFANNLYSDYTISNVTVNGDPVDPRSVNLVTDSVTGLKTFYIDVDSYGYYGEEVSINFDVTFTGSYLPDYYSTAISPDDYGATDRTADYIMLSAGFYLQTYDYLKGVFYNDGYNTGVSAYDGLGDTVFTVVAAPFEAISNFLNFEILGINLRWIFSFILTAVIIAFVVKKVKA